MTKKNKKNISKEFFVNSINHQMNIPKVIDIIKEYGILSALVPYTLDDLISAKGARMVMVKSNGEIIPVSYVGALHTKTCWYSLLYEENENINPVFDIWTKDIYEGRVLLYDYYVIERCIMDYEELEKDKLFINDLEEE